MAKITLPDISSGFATSTQLNSALNSIEAELQDKVLYRNNPVGEPNQMEGNLDMNGNSIINAAGIEVGGIDYLEEMNTIYNNYLSITQNVTVSVNAPSGGADGDIWFQVSA
jgi:hypothetical protein